MAATRQLPDHRNPLLEEERVPAYEILVERRCLGQTELKVKPGQVGTSSATKPDNLGVLDYAHLRVPLPKDLSSSGIFSRGTNKKYPEAYFLMRRSSDGYISATGMFKAAFPYAQVEDETAEKDFIKGLSATSSEEVAGNVWIHPDQALDLSNEYGIRTWIEALLDPEPITHGTNDSSKAIRSPPTYRVKDMLNGSSTRSPKSERKSTTATTTTTTTSSSSNAESRRSVRGSRSTRSVSPTKKPQTPARKIATPRKRRGGRGITASVEPETINGDAVGAEHTKTNNHHETVKVEVETLTQPTASIREEADDTDELTSTKVNVELPSNHPDLKIPDDPKALMAEARKMVAEAEKLTGGSSSASTATSSSALMSRAGGKGKRKAEQMVEMDDEVGLEGPSGAGAKRPKTDIDLRKERLKTRTMLGIGATLAIGGLVPVIMTAFGS